MAAASGASPAPPDREWRRPAVAASFAVGDVVLAYHGSLLYEAVIKEVVQAPDGRPHSYVVNYQGFKKSWDAQVAYNAVFEHNDENLRVAHQLLQGAKQRQQAIRPVDDRHISPIDRQYVTFMVPPSFPHRNSVDPANSSLPKDATKSPSVLPTPNQHYSSPLDYGIPQSSPAPDPYPGMMPSGPAPQPNPPPNRPTGAPTQGASPPNAAAAADRIAPATATGAAADEEWRQRGAGSAQPPRPLASQTEQSLFFLPQALKLQLVDDWEFVTKENRLVPLPRSVTVEKIVDNWVQTYASPEDIACREVAEGIKAYFDAALPTMLLYKFERLQFNEFYFGPNSMARNEAYPVKHYGAEHLLRLLLKLPYMLESTGVDMDMMRRIAEKVNELAAFLVDNGRLFFLMQYEQAGEEYIRKVEKGDIEPDQMDTANQNDSPTSIDAPTSHPSPITTSAQGSAHSIARSPATHLDTPSRSTPRPTTSTDPPPIGATASPAHFNTPRI